MQDEPTDLSDALRPLFEYWISVRGEKLIPSRDDIDPAQIPRKVLPNIVLMDVVQTPLRFRYRLMGTAITDMIGMDWTGRYVDELPCAGTYVHEQCIATLNSSKPCVYFSDWNDYDPHLMQHKSLRYERLLLPLSNTEQTISMLLGGTFVYNFSS